MIAKLVARSATRLLSSKSIHVFGGHELSKWVGRGIGATYPMRPLSSTAIDHDCAYAATNSDLWKRRKDAVPHGIKSATQLFVSDAENAEMWDVEGKRYIDFAGSMGVLNTGHRHPRVVAAVKEQLSHVMHPCFQVMPYESYVELAERLNDIVAPSLKLTITAKTILLATGADAVEHAIKIARSYTRRPGVISFGGAFHGRTGLGVDHPNYKVAPYKYVGPLCSEVYEARFPHEYGGVTVQDSMRDLEHLLESSVDADRIAAVVIEPVQGDDGIKVAPLSFMHLLRQFCDLHGILLIADEVQCGFAHTGKFFAMDHYAAHGCRADMIITAKSIGGGLPLSAVVGAAEVMDSPAPGELGGTYAVNPLACAAACAVMDVLMEEEGILDRANRLGGVLCREVKKLAASKGRQNGIGEVRGLGAMVAFDFVHPQTTDPDPARTKAAVSLAAERGLMIRSCGFHENTISALVPIMVEEDLFMEGVGILTKVIEETQ